jgi:hypothetical protein
LLFFNCWLDEPFGRGDVTGHNLELWRSYEYAGNGAFMQPPVFEAARRSALAARIVMENDLLNDSAVYQGIPLNKDFGGARKKVAGRTLNGKTYSEFPTRQEHKILPESQRILEIEKYSTVSTIDIPLTALSA